MVAEAWSNPTGGAGRGDWSLIGADLVAEAPASLFRGPAAGSVYAHVRGLMHHRRDGAFSDYVGSFHPVSNTFASEQLRVYNLYYRHAPAQAGWQIKVGQLALDDDFAVSAGGSHFLNAAFGALPTLTGTPVPTDRGGGAAFPIYSVAAPGVWFSRELGGDAGWQAGLYHGGPGSDRRGNHGFRWDSLSRSGLVAVTELALEHRVGSRAATTRVGASLHTGTFEDAEALAMGSPDAKVRRLWSVYATHDFTLVPSDDPAAPRLLGFGRVGLAPQSDRAAVSHYADFGLVSHGLVPARPQDVAGAGVSYSHFGRGFRRVNGLGQTETVAEVFYAVAATARLTITADLQWVFNATRDAAVGDRGTAAVVGLRTRFAW